MFLRSRSPIPISIAGALDPEPGEAAGLATVAGRMVLVVLAAFAGLAVDRVLAIGDLLRIVACSDNGRAGNGVETFCPDTNESMNPKDPPAKTTSRRPPLSPALRQAREAIDRGLSRDRGRLHGLWSRWRGRPD